MGLSEHLTASVGLAAIIAIVSTACLVYQRKLPEEQDDLSDPTDAATSAKRDASTEGRGSPTSEEVRAMVEEAGRDKKQRKITFDGKLTKLSGSAPKSAASEQEAASSASLSVEEHALAAHMQVPATPTKGELIDAVKEGNLEAVKKAHLRQLLKNEDCLSPSPNVNT